MKIFIVNLPESTERKKNIVQQFNNLGVNDYEFISAIRGSSLTTEELNKYYNSSKCVRRNKRELTLGEIGCSLSHRMIYQKIVDSDIEKAIVIEDDVIINSEFSEVISLLEKCKINNCIIKLDIYRKIRDIKTHRVHLNDQFTILHPLSEVQMTWGYFIDRKAARSMLMIHTPVFTAADDWFFFRRSIKLRIMNVPIIQDAGFVSEIGSRPVIEKPQGSRLLKKVLRTYQDIITWYN